MLLSIVSAVGYGIGRRREVQKHCSAERCFSFFDDVETPSVFVFPYKYIYIYPGGGRDLRSKSCVAEDVILVG